MEPVYAFKLEHIADNEHDYVLEYTSDSPPLNCTNRLTLRLAPQPDEVAHSSAAAHLTIQRVILPGFARAFPGRAPEVPKDLPYDDQCEHYIRILTDQSPELLFVQRRWTQRSGYEHSIFIYGRSPGSVHPQLIDVTGHLCAAYKFRRSTKTNGLKTNKTPSAFANYLSFILYGDHRLTSRVL